MKLHFTAIELARTYKQYSIVSLTAHARLGGSKDRSQSALLAEQVCVYSGRQANWKQSKSNVNEQPSLLTA